MDVRIQDSLLAVQRALEQMIIGKSCGEISQITDEPEFRQVFELIDILNNNLQEMNEFANHLAKGNLDVPIPNRRNYLASQLKQLHTQLSGFVWSVQQLKSGHVVDRLDYMGELSDAFNVALERMGQINNEDEIEEKMKYTDQFRHHQLISALNQLRVMVIELDKEVRVIYPNHYAHEHLGKMTYLQPISVVPKNKVVIEKLSSFQMAHHFPMVGEVFDRELEKWYKITSDEISIGSDKKGYLHMIEDITEWKVCEIELRFSASMDSLTNTYNRKIGIENLNRMLKNTKQSTHCVAFLDLDNLKTINDDYGHTEGDYAISTVAKVMMSVVRKSDIVSRYGGDEFMIIFPHCPIDSAERAISKMKDKLQDFNSNSRKPYLVDFSHGVVEIGSSHQYNTEDIIMLADKKMYERKQQKKERTM